MNLSDIQLLFDYNYWANGLMLSQAAELTAQQLAQPTEHFGGRTADTDEKRRPMNR